MIDYNDLTKNIKDGLKFPTGATSKRGNPSKGSLRFNSETGKPEIYAKSRGWKTEASSGSSAAYITTDLVVDLDAGNPNSYSGSGNTWTDLKGNMDMTFSNGSNFTYDSSGWFTNPNGAWYNSTGPFVHLSDGRFTIDSWFKYNSLPSGHSYFIENKSASSYQDGGLRIGIENYSHYPQPFIKAYYYKRPLEVSTSCFNSFSDWVHFSYVVDYDGSRSYFTIYVNGVVSSEGVQQPAPWQHSQFFPMNNSANRFFTLGAYSVAKTTLQDSINSISDIGDTNIASFRLYNSALSSSDIASNFNNTKSRFGL